MTWFAAHIILALSYRDGVQENYPVLENVVLISANSAAEAWEKAERKGALEGSVGECIFSSGRAGVWEFVGIRRLMKCIEDFDPDERVDGYLENGSEVTYFPFTLSTKEDLEKLIVGDTVPVRYDKEIDPE